MKKVLIIQRILSHYRVPLFEGLGKLYDLTIAYSEKTEDWKNCLKSLKIEYPTGKWNKMLDEDELFASVQEFIDVCKKYDVVVLPMIPYRKSLYVAERLRKYVKLIFWGIGVSADYDKRYDAEDYRRPSFESMAAMADASVFYTEYPKNKYIEYGIPKGKMFVAPNTVEVTKVELNRQEKDSLLFVGTLLKQKKVQLLLETYKKVFDKNSCIPELKIIGEGEEYENIDKWIKENNLSEKIKLQGPIYEEDLLKEHFLHAIATVSADQAGLTVLKSMGYGVPFITNKNAITGGEIFNIVNGVNGVLFENYNELEKILLDIIDNPQKYEEMGKRAYQYYYSNRTVEKWIQGFADAIEYAMSKDGRSND